MNWLRFNSSERDLVSRIEAIIAGTKSEPDAAYTFDRLKTLTRAESSALLTLALQELVASGKLRTIVRVESPKTHGGIGEFGSVNELPAEIYDWRSGVNVEVRPENVRILFATPKSA